MPLTRFHRQRSGIFAGTLAAALVIGFGGEVFRPGHHVHLDAGGLHHHHFFVGAHSHEHPVHDRAELDREPGGHLAASDHGDGHSPEPGDPAERPRDRDSSPGLIAGFALDAPRAPIGLTAPIPAPVAAATGADAPALADPVPLPGGARAPPAFSLV